MALMHARQSRRAAFTLVELLVVIGIMAVLATISVAGYSAASRGMADRGVIQSTVSILRIAQQTCEIDRVPTKVLFFNRRLSDSGSSDSDATLFQGTAIAIKQAGRISVRPSMVGGLLVDEFADWHQSYPMTGAENSPVMRLFRMKAGEDESQDIDGCSTSVRPFVKSHALEDYMIQSGTQINDWCRTHRRDASDNRPNGAQSYVPNGNNYVWGFEEKSGSGGSLAASSWGVGDPYGVEIARIDLPKGYIFGTSAPSSDRLQSASVREVHFDPEKFEPTPTPGSVPISLMRPSGATFSPKSVGTVDSGMLRDDRN